MKIKPICVVTGGILLFVSGCSRMETLKCNPLTDVTKIEKVREVLTIAFSKYNQNTFARYESFTQHRYEECGTLVKAEFTLVETPEFTPTEGGDTFLIDLGREKIISQIDN